MKVKDSNKWMEIRKRGMLRYILVNGVLLWGIPIGLAITVLSIINTRGFLKFNIIEVIAGYIIAGIIYGIPIGGIFGFMKWQANERHWNEKKAKDKTK